MYLSHDKGEKKVKRIIILSLAFILLLSLAGCGEKNNKSDGDTSVPASTQKDLDKPLMEETIEVEDTESQPAVASNNTTEPNGDGYTPYNLQWVDGSKGLISFKVQSLNLGADVCYNFTLYHDAMDVMNTGITSFQGSMLVEENLAEFMRYPGEYYFTVSAWDGPNRTAKSEIIVSPVYNLDGEIEFVAPTDSDSDISDTASDLAQSSFPDGGTFEGDENGYGVWTYGKFRYEGNWANGKPNGEGTLYANTYDDIQFDSSITGTWIDGYADGDMVYRQIWGDGTIEEFTAFSVKQGKVDSKTGIYGDKGTSIDIMPEDVAVIPPWGDVSVAACR